MKNNLELHLELEKLYTLIPRRVKIEYSGSPEKIGDSVTFYGKKDTTIIMNYEIPFTDAEEAFKVIQEKAPVNWDYFVGIVTENETLLFSIGELKMTNKTDNINWKSGDELEAPGLYIQRLDGTDDFVVTRLVAHIGAVNKIIRKLYYANSLNANSMDMKEVHQLEQLHAEYFGPIPE